MRARVCLCSNAKPEHASASTVDIEAERGTIRLDLQMTTLFERVYTIERRANSTAKTLKTVGCLHCETVEQ